jgi:hypothetical protein
MGAKEQCDLYPRMLSLLAEESGITVHTVEIADAIAPATNINKSRSFNIHLIVFRIFIYLFPYRLFLNSISGIVISFLYK